MKNNSFQQKKSIIILGPSASGKTKLAIEVAKKLNKDIISADSRQIYKGLDYSTGKLNSGDTYQGSSLKEEGKWILDGVNYWGYDIIEPNIEFSAGDFVEFASKLIDKKNYPIICGGTGMYIAALTGKIELSKVTQDKKLRTELESLSLNELHSKLVALKYDLSKLNNSELNNKQRLVRKIEILSNNNNQKKTDKKVVVNKEECIFIGLKNNEYKSKIEQWVKNNFYEIEKEVTWLIKKYPNSPLFTGFIFKEMKSYINNKITKSETENLITTKYLQYIKRQMTYFKKYFPETKWFDNKNEALDFILNNI